MQTWRRCGGARASRSPLLLSWSTLYMPHLALDTSEPSHTRTVRAIERNTKPATCMTDTAVETQAPCRTSASDSSAVTASLQCFLDKGLVKLKGAVRSGQGSGHGRV